MDNSLRFPWGGDVNQSINPWDFWIKSVSSQLGLINVKNVMSSDSRIEQEIVEDVASYGRQLGQIADVLNVLIKQHEMGDLKPGEKQIVSRYEKMTLEIERVKRKWKTPEKLLAELDAMLTQIKALKADFPETFEMAAAKIKTELQIIESESQIGVKSVRAGKSSPRRGADETKSSDIAGLDLSQPTDKATIITSKQRKNDLG